MGIASYTACMTVLLLKAGVPAGPLCVEQPNQLWAVFTSFKQLRKGFDWDDGQREKKVASRPAWPTKETPEYWLLLRFWLRGVESWTHRVAAAGE